jgi:type I restriction enzyme S subunit
MSQLPQNWIRTRLDCISEIVLGQSPPSSTYNESGKGLPFYQGKLEFGKVYPVPKKWCSEPKKTAEKGDILVSVRAPVGPTNICLEKSCIGRGLAAIRGFGGIETLFILYLLRANENVLAGKGTGTTFSAISGEQLRSLEIPLPPLNEQRRIVGKVEELFSYLDAGVESLRKVQAQLKRCRQAVLKYAFEGKLTEEWRKTHKDQIEPAPKFLEKVKQDLKRATPNKLAELGLNNESGFQELPETWVWATIGELETFIGSGITPRGGRTVYVQEGIPFIRSQNVYPDGLRLEEIAYVTPKMHDTMKRTKAYPNDVLLNITGASIGRSAVIPEKLPEANVNQHVCIIRTGWWLIPAYLSHFLNSPIGQTQIFGTQSGVTRQGLNYEQVRRLKIPLAPLMEQNEIVTKIEATYTATGQVEKTIRQNINHVEYLRQSILKDAFGGKLVPQDPDDEPAEKLLERIKAEHISNRTPKFSNQLELSRYVK